METTVNSSVVDATLKYLHSIGLDLDAMKFTGNNIMIRCPFASVGGHASEIDRKPSFGIKIDSSGFTFNCFTCGRKGRSLISFVEMLNSEDITNVAVESVYALQNSIQIKFPKFGQSDVVEKKKQEPVELKGLKKKSLPLYNYNLKRGVKKSITEELNFRFNNRTNRVVFPIYDYEQNLVGTVSHSINGEQPKYKNSDFNVGDYLYLEWLIKGGVGIIVEGMYDAVIVYQHLKDLGMLRDYSVVSTFGSKISSGQRRKLIKFFDTIILMGDNDMAGIKMEKDIYNSIRKKVPLIFKAGYKGKDPADISKKKFKIYINNIVPFGCMVR
jgi:DNA primase